MKNLKLAVIFLSSFLAANFSHAQTIEEGRKFLYYEKFISAKNVFQQLVTANLNNDEAAYWLGQTYIAPDEDKDTEGAKAVYQKALVANPNSALLNAGMGHVELLEGKVQEARNHFETAISLSKGKSIVVLDAIGFANGDFYSKLGDAAYAVEKLQLATAIKGFKDAGVLTNLGDAYRKLQDGGAAQRAYESALAIDPKYARAKFRIGRIYQSQGRSQEAIYLQYYDEAIALDPNYTPVYFCLHQYYYQTDVVKSATYLEKYLMAKGADEPNACFLRAQMVYAQANYAGAIAKCDECIAAAGGNPYPNVYGIKAYAANKMGDSINAKTAFDMYFQKQKPAKIGALDYLTYAIVLLKFEGNESLAGTFIDKAVDLDSTEIDKAAHLKLVATIYEARKQYKDAADWYKKIVMVKAAPTRTDIFNAGYNYYRSGDPESSITLFNIFTQKYADEVLGYYWVGKASWVIDSTMALGMANPAFEKVIQLGEPNPDKSKIKAQLMTAFKYMIVYTANIKKDKAGALAFCDRALLVDSTDQEVIGNRDAISKMNMNAPAPKAAAVTFNARGEKVSIGADGTVTTVAKDGTTTIVTKAGKITTIKNGVTTIQENGKITTIDKEGKITIMNLPKPGGQTPAPKKK